MHVNQCDRPIARIATAKQILSRSDLQTVSRK
jgi:hypothetical protein